MAPTYDCLPPRLYFTRPTTKFCPGTSTAPSSVSESRVTTSRNPISSRPTLPVSFSPTRMGTVRPPTSPILREKNGIREDEADGRPNWKTPASSTKNARFSG